MVDYIYSYFILILLLMFVWIVLFIWRKDTRRQMLFLSWPLAVVGLFFEALYVRDWWSPLTITGSLIGIEDFFFSFAIAGIATVIYEDVFKKKLRERKISEKFEEKKRTSFYWLVFLFLILFYVLFFVFDLDTFWSTNILLLGLLIWLWAARRDLILDSIVSGVLLTGVVAVIYFIVEMITPGWIQQFWYFVNTPEIYFLGLPIDDLVFYLLFGAVVGPFYEFWMERKLINKK